MKLALWILCGISWISLVGCMQPHEGISAAELKQCKAQCLQRYESCKMTCIDSCPQCSAQATHAASINYTKYVHEKQIEGGTISRVLKSYRDPLQCRKVTCNCSSDFAICNQGCTGIIQKRLRSAPYCT